MKKTILTLMLIAAMSTTANAAEIPRECAPQNATEDAIVIVENIIDDILDVVVAGDLGYTEACGYANTRVRKAVIAGETNGYGYALLSAITQNAIRDTRNSFLGNEIIFVETIPCSSHF